MTYIIDNIKKDQLGRLHLTVKDLETGTRAMDIRIYNIHQQRKLKDFIIAFIEAQNK